MKSVLLNMLTAFITLLTINSCSPGEIGDSKDVNPETVYQQFILSYKEGDENFESLSQFRFAGENGTTLVLSKPSVIAFDTKIIAVDSNDFAGAYYATRQPAGNFYGKHCFSFTDINQKTYKNDVTIDSFKLDNLPQSVSKSTPLAVSFTGLSAGADYIIEASSSSTDSTFTISYSSSDKKSFLEIPASELLRQKGKTMILNISVTEKIPLQNATKEGGIIMINYELKPVKLMLEENAPVSFLSNKTGRGIKSI